MRSTRRQFLVIAGLVVLGGCASGGGGSDPDTPIGEAAEGRVAVEIRNNWIPATTITAYHRSPGRQRRILGQVLSNATETFVIETRNLVAGFVLIAEKREGEQLVSNPIRTVTRAKLTWNMGSNTVTEVRLP